MTIHCSFSNDDVETLQALGHKVSQTVLDASFAACFAALELNLGGSSGRAVVDCSCGRTLQAPQSSFINVIESLGSLGETHPTQRAHARAPEPQLFPTRLWFSNAGGKRRAGIHQ